MNASRALSFTLLLLALFIFATGLKGVRADEVQLKNGDRISGTIVTIYTRTGFRVSLVRRLSATLQYNWELDNAVPPGEDEIDQRILLTLGWELGNYGGQFRQGRRLDYIIQD